MTQNIRTNRRRRGQRGNFLIEYALSMVFVMIPLFLGVTFLALGLGRSIQSESVCRDANNMYSRGVDFSFNQNKNVLVRLAAGIDLQIASGSSVVYLTQVTYVTDVHCAAAGLVPPCANRNMVVVMQRQIIGNTSLGESLLATPNSGLLDSRGNLSTQEQLQDASARVPTMGGPGCTTCVASLNSGEVAWIAEVRVSPIYGVPTAQYSRSII